MTDVYDHRDRCAIVGIGATDFSRDSGRSDLSLAAQAALAALDDAGLTAADVDGIVPGVWTESERALCGQPVQVQEEEEVIACAVG